MQTNILRALIDLLPQDPLLVATVTAVHGDGTVTVEFPGSGSQRVRGTAAVDDNVFVRSGRIEGEAADLPVVTILV